MGRKHGQSLLATLQYTGFSPDRPIGVLRFNCCAREFTKEADYASTFFFFFLGIYNRDLHVTLFPAPMFYWSLPLFLWPLRDPRHPKALVRLTTIMAFQTPSAPNIPYQRLIAG